MKNHFALLAVPGILGASLSPALAIEPQPASEKQAVTAPHRFRFRVIDPQTRRPIPAAWISLEIQSATDSQPHPIFLRTDPTTGLTNAEIDAETGRLETVGDQSTPVTVPLGVTMVIAQKAAPPATTGGKPRVQDIYIKVTASRLPIRSGNTAAGTTRTNQQLSTYVNRAGNDSAALTRGQSGVTSDSNGQQHVRGEHADISFVVDGVPLPDTLSGRQGSVVVASTIRSLDILTGGFAPEFGGQTAAVLDVETLPGVASATADLNLQGGSYGTFNSVLTAAGPIGKRASYVVNVSNNRSDNAVEPQQPDVQTAHNSGQDQSYFGKFRTAPKPGDSFTLTLSHAPSHVELSNRTGLGSRFESAGQGFGFLGLRNADGTRPDVTDETAGLMGSETVALPSQQSLGQLIYADEVNEFATASYRHAFNDRETGEISAVVLHSGQKVKNRSPNIDLNNLPVDSSLEYNPTAKRSVYHYQVSGFISATRGKHRYKTGVLNDQQNGDESYQLVPGSQLALNELASLAPNLAPAGTQGDVTDVNGNPIYGLVADPKAPTLTVHRSGFYRAAYIQDTWQVSRQFVANYGLRYDWFEQKQDIGQQPVSKSELSPRLNFSLGSPAQTLLRWSFNHLFNVPPLAQGAVVGEAIQPETLNQYDVSLERRLAPGQTAKAAYYYKEIKNQVDTGLLIPGSQIGLYSAINLQYGGVHGLELSYEAAPPRGVGLDGYINYSYAIARPNGLDNTGAPVPTFNDHDQRHTVGAGIAYLWKGGASAAFTLTYGSGLASSPIPPSTNRIPRSEVDVHMTSGDKFLHGRGGIGLDVANLFDSREVINFQSAFSGTRFQQGRRILASIFGTF